MIIICVWRAAKRSNCKRAGLETVIPRGRKHTFVVFGHLWPGPRSGLYEVLNKCQQIQIDT